MSISVKINQPVIISRGHALNTVQLAAVVHTPTVICSFAVK